MLFLLLFFAMIACTCSPCDGFRNDTACQVRALRGKKQWDLNIKRYKCKAVLKHKKRYYIARDEYRSMLDNIIEEESKEETWPYQVEPNIQLDNTPTDSNPTSPSAAALTVCCLLTPPLLQGSHNIPSRSSKLVHVAAAANEDTEGDDLDVVPHFNRMQYSIPDPKSRAPASSFPETPSPLQDATTIRLMCDIHSMQLNLARAKK
jgi:hypothetical protein